MHNFDKFRHSLVIFGMNHPEKSLENLAKPSEYCYVEMKSHLTSS